MTGRGFVLPVLLCSALLGGGSSDLLTRNPRLQADLESVLRKPEYRRRAEEGRLSVMLVDLSDAERGPVYAGVSEDTMRYAASLPKIGILLTAFELIERDKLALNTENDRLLSDMIRVSSNRAATEMIRRVGFETIAETLSAPRYRFYQPSFTGGIWVGKDYGGGLGRWRRDPAFGISHGATARQAARFFLMLDREKLVSRSASRRMKEILGDPGIEHKFVKGLRQRPGSVIYRKSGTWGDWHSDAALVERNGRKYIAVALLECPRGKGLLSELILDLDDLIFEPRASIIK